MNRFFEAFVDYGNKVLELMGSIEETLLLINKKMDLSLQVEACILRHYNQSIKLFRTTENKKEKEN